VCFSNSIVLRYLKTFAIEKQLPILKRKWDKINVDYIGLVEKAKFHKEKVKKYLKYGLSVKEISKKIELSYSGVYAIIHRNDL